MFGLCVFVLLKLKAEKPETTGASRGTEWYYRLAANFSDHLSNIFWRFFLTILQLYQLVFMRWNAGYILQTGPWTRIITVNRNIRWLKLRLSLAILMLEKRLGKPIRKPELGSHRWVARWEQEWCRTWPTWLHTTHPWTRCRSWSPPPGWGRPQQNLSTRERSVRVSGGLAEQCHRSCETFGENPGEQPGPLLSLNTSNMKNTLWLYSVCHWWVMDGGGSLQYLSMTNKLHFWTETSSHNWIYSSDWNLAATTSPKSNDSPLMITLNILW